MMPDPFAAIADPLHRGVELRVSWFTSRIIRKDTLRTQCSKLEIFFLVPCNSISSFDRARDPELVEGRRIVMNHAG